jgi:methyl-accepting chemotaxis protein
MSNVSIRSMMLTAISILGVLAAALVAVNAWFDHVVSQKTEQMQAAYAARSDLREARFQVSQMQQFITDAAATQNRAALDEARQAEKMALAAIAAWAKSPQAQAAVASAMSQSIDDLVEEGRRMVDAYIQNGRDAGNAIMSAATGFDAQAQHILRKLATLAQTANDAALAAERDFTQAGQDNAFITNAALLGFLLTVGAAFWVLYQKVVPPLGHLRGALQQLQRGEGDLSGRLSKVHDDEVGAIVEAFNEFMARFCQLVTNLKRFVGELDGATEQILTVTERTKSEMNHQQGETQQVAASIGEMAATVQEVANSASATASATHAAQQEANSGRKVVGETMDAIHVLAEEVQRAGAVIGRLEQDSEQIGSVLDVIRGIADQTNLLALNAAIEAARAGEQGRGFAVVADEVRTLASRTQQSTREIQEMIERLQEAAREAVQVMNVGTEQAQASVSQAALAGKSLDTIADAVSSINGMSAQIATAAEQQTAAAAEISRNVESINMRAEHNSEGANRAAECTRRLVDLKDELHDLVANYRV